MIEKSLSYIQECLNEHINRQFKLDDKIVVLSNLINKDGKVSSSNENKVILSLVNVEQDISLKNLQPPPRDPSGVLKSNLPLDTNCYILVAANFYESNYRTGLKLISSIIQFFQANPSWNKQNSPGLPVEIVQMRMELYTQSFEQLNHLWSALGCKYMPSILYKVRLITINNNIIVEQLPGIKPIGDES